MLRKKAVLAGTGVVLAALLAVPFALVGATPASAVNACTTGQFPNRASAQSGLDVACLFDYSATSTANVGGYEIHDALNASWHRGAARTAAINTTSASTTITYTSGVLSAADIGRPISGPGIQGGAFITTATATSGTISQTATATGTAVAVKIEHTRARLLVDATVTTAASSNLTSATAKFSSADVNKSVSGGAFTSGAKITAFVNATTVTVAPAATLASTNDTITIGATTYSGTTPTYTGTDTRQIRNSAASGAVGVACSGSTLTGSATGGSFQTDDIGLKVRFINGAAPVTYTGKITAVSTVAPTTATLSAPCPSTGTAPFWTHVVIGEPGANAPANLDSVVTFSATLNLNPTLVKTADDCNKNTYEGFELAGRYVNPGSYPVAQGTLPRTIAQIAFPTAVVSFGAFIVPVATDAQQAGPHYDFLFPSLPVGASVCPIVTGTTTNKTAVSLDFFAASPAGGNTISGTNTLPASAFLPTGGGNPSAPSGRALDNRTGTFGQKIILKNSSGTVLNTLAPTGCAIVASTTAPTLAIPVAPASAGTGYGCGDG